MGTRIWGDKPALQLLHTQDASRDPFGLEHQWTRGRLIKLVHLGTGHQNLDHSRQIKGSGRVHVVNQKKTHPVEAKKQGCAMSFAVDPEIHVSLGLNLHFFFS